MSGKIERMLARTVKITRRVPDPPRDPRFSGGVVWWKAPRKTDNVTHYNVYANSETNLVRQVPKGQTYLADSLTADRLFIAAYNEATDAESSKVLLNGPITSAAVAAGYETVTVSGANEATPNGAYAGHQIALDRATTTIKAITNPVVGSRHVIVLIQDVTGGRQVSWNANYVNIPPVQLDVRPSTTSTFDFIVRADGKAHCTGVLVGTT